MRHGAIGFAVGCVLMLALSASARLKPEHEAKVRALVTAQRAVGEAFAEPSVAIENVRRLGLHLVRVADVSAALVAQHRTADALRALEGAVETLKRDVLGAAVKAVGKLDDGRPDDPDGGLPGYVIPPFLTTASAPR